MELKSGFKVGPWEVRPLTGELTGGGEPARLEPKVMEVLVALAQQPGEVVEREELLRRVWGNRAAVSDEPLTRCIAELRRAFGDSRQAPTYIQTIPKRGYRLSARSLCCTELRRPRRDDGPPVTPAPRAVAARPKARCRCRRARYAASLWLVAVLPSRSAPVRRSCPAGPEVRGRSRLAADTLAVLSFATEREPRELFRRRRSGRRFDPPELSAGPASDPARLLIRAPRRG